MFTGFEGQRDPGGRRRILLSTGASILAYAVGGLLLVALARGRETLAAVKEVSVVFQAPPPPLEIKPAPAPEPKPAIPPTMKVKKVRVPQVQPLREIKEIPEEKPPEADPSNDEVLVDQEGGDSSGEGGGDSSTATTLAPPAVTPKPAPKPRGAINLPESAIAPVPLTSNAAPEFPEEARIKGLEGQVILKVVISEKGEVTKIEVLRGEDPFTEAALVAVRAWLFSPALVEGHATPVFRIIKIPFRLKA